MVDDIDVNAELAIAPDDVKLFFKKENQTLCIPDGSIETIRQSTKTMKRWFVLFFHDKHFKKHFGFDQRTDDLDLWPAVFCLKPLIDKFAIIAPKLFYKNGDEWKHICYGLEKRFEDERTGRRRKLKLREKTAKKKGTLSLKNYCSKI